MTSEKSPELKQGDVTWNVRVTSYCSGSEKFLSIGLSGDQICSIRLVVRLLRANDQVIIVQKVITQTVDAEQIVCINQIISWDDLLRPENGFIEKTSVMLEFEVQITDGIYLQDLSEIDFEN